MASKTLIAALSMIAAVSPLSVASAHRSEMTSAPSGGADTRYCMHVEAFTGSLIEQVRCWTREDWASQGVDVDRHWPANGVRTIG